MAEILDIALHLTAKQREALQLMAAGLALRQVSERTGVAIQTLYNWRSSHATFRLELDLVQRRLHEEGLNALRGLVHEATATLAGVMASPNSRDSDRIAAARTVLQFCSPGDTASPGSGPDSEDAEFLEVAEDIARLVRAADAR